jgi:pyruvate/2-oxoglutarate dehydrogenase complex dihydrolipoamide acyltransferase (E2) component
MCLCAFFAPLSQDIKLESVKGTGPDGAITKEDVDHVIAKKQKN